MANSVPTSGRSAQGFGFDAMPEWLDRPEHFEGLARRRVFAYLIDAFVIGCLFLAAWAIFWVVSIASLGLLFPLMILAYSAVPLIPGAYHTLLIGGSRSATIGMRVLDIEMRSQIGGKPDYIQALIGTVLFYLTLTFTGGLLLLVGVFNRRRRLLHDLLSGMVAVRASTVTRPQIMPPDGGRSDRGRPHA